MHVHVSEQPGENDACLSFYGATPTSLLDVSGLLGPSSTVVHATHVADNDIATLGRTRTTTCACPTTERDLADGIGPMRSLYDTGSPLSLGSDQHALIDMFEEARGLEMHERLTSLRRGRFSQAELLAALTRHAAIGWEDAGRLEAGARPTWSPYAWTPSARRAARRSRCCCRASASDVDTVPSTGASRRGGSAPAEPTFGDHLLQQAIEPLSQNECALRSRLRTHGRPRYSRQGRGLSS
jgi:cytosine/adenosine deaminase-related metal-dependent hydrolase